jgi:FHA domain-containing protein
MSISGAAANLSPRDLVEDAESLDLLGFLARYGDAQLLLVRIPEGDTELELGLGSPAPVTGTGRNSLAGPLPFRTGLQEPPRALRNEKVRRQEPVALRQLVEKQAYFAVPVRKREDSDALFMGRISIGRARNKDIVLRHSSVSKFHAWFEVDPSEELFLCDAGSTNLTHVNGEPVEPRARTGVGPGDAVRFGAIETILCSPRTFWEAIHEAKGTGAVTH